MTVSPLIELRGIARSFRAANAEPALRGVDLTIEAGEFVAISGASGSGKSTLMNVIGLLDRPTRGTYRLRGQDVSRIGDYARARLRRDTVGFVFQDYHLIAELDLLRNVELPAVYAGAPAAERHRRAAALLADLGLGTRLHSRPGDLSGGQQQRVSIARALMNGGELILADEPTGALDSRTGAEVLRLLSDLADAGHTIVLVTHDPKVAAVADRRIEMADGRIVSDTGRAGSGRRPVPEPPVRPFGGHGGGIFGEAARMAFAALGASPARTLLTLLGIVIGVAALIATSAITRGNQVVLGEQMAALGTDWIMLGPMEGAELKSSRPLTPGDAEAIAGIPNVAAVMPAIWYTATVQHGARTASTQALGTTGAFVAVHDWDTSRGRFFTDADVAADAPVLLLGATVAGKLFPDTDDPSGAFVLLDGKPFLVSGVLAGKGTDGDGEDRDDTVVIPLGTMAHRIVGRDGLTAVIVRIADMGGVAETMEAARALLVERHGREDFWLWDASASFRDAETSRAAINRTVVAVTGLSILVGGIGVMNIMLMGVQQRRREIGIRSATGATPRDILRQFLTEAVVLSAVGAAVGLLLGLAIALGATLSGSTVVFSLRTILAVALGGIAVGAVFGLLPALHAARLDPSATLGR